MRSPLTPLTPRRTAQLVVWTLLAVFVAVAGWSLSHPVPVTPSHPTYTIVRSDQVHTAADGTITTDSGHTYALGAMNAITSDRNQYSGDGADVSGTSWFAEKKASDLLPASRWDTVGLKSTKESWSDIGTQFSGTIGGFLFSIAGLIWSALFWLVIKAMSMDVISTAGAQLNAGAAALGSGLMGSGVIGILLIMLAFSVGGVVLRRGGKGAASMVAAFVVPIAILQIVLSSIGATQTTDAKGQTTTNTNSAAWGLTPAGLAQRGNIAVSSVAEGVTMKLAAATKTGVGQHTPPSPCDYYYASLYHAYEVKSADETGYTSGAVMLLSQLWQDTFLAGINDAQFGVPEEGARAICFHLEWEQDTHLNEIIDLAGVSDPDSPYTGFDTGANTAFKDVADQHDHNTALLAWIACGQDGDYSKGRTEWQFDGDANLDDFCAGWKSGDWTGNDGGVHDTLEYHSGTDADSRDYNTDDVAYTVIVSNLGQDGNPNRLTQGIVAIATAASYTAALTMPAAGAAIASFGLGLFLVMFPATLLLLAVPNKGGGAANKAGTKLLKTTGTFILSKGMFLVVLALLIQFVSIFNVVLGVR